VAFLIPENLRTRRDVPPAVATLARILSDHLDFGATVWYEPLFAVDDQRPDLVVLVPDAGVLVLQVLQAKRTAVVGIAGNVLTVKDEGGARVEVPHPLARARSFAEAIQRRAREAGIAADDELPVLAAGVFGYIDRRTAQERGLDAAVDVGVCLFREDIDQMAESADAARSTLARLLAAPPRGVVSDEAERLYRAVIHPDTVLTPVQGELPGITDALTADVKALDREQEALAKTIGSGHRVIRGVAGSGKTVVLVHRARLLAKLHPRERILVACYNRSLQGYLQRQLQDHRNITVSTVHRQLGVILRMAGHEGIAGDEPFAAAAGRALGALDSLNTRGASHERQLFDHVLVDEAQDLPIEALRFLVRMLRRGSDSLLVVADAAQSLYGRGFTWKDAGIEAAGRTRVLRRNYRNTRQILDFAWSFLSRELSLGVDLDDSSGMTDTVVPPEASARNGALPLVQQLPSRDAEVHSIAATIREWLDEGVQAGDIAVLYGSRFAGGGGFHWVDKLSVAFERVGVPWYWPTNPDDRAAKTTVGSRRDQVLVSTIHSAKGLEFPRVILCAYLDQRPPEEMAASRRLIYVGMTRAVDRLVLTASGKHRFITDLEEGPGAG
jgi:superfamily I DNA and RNA helicase